MRKALVINEIWSNSHSVLTFFAILSMRIKKTNKRPYLTKRILIRAARAGIRKAEKETLAIMGFNVIAENGWVVKKFLDGRIEKIARLESAENSQIVLD